MSLGFSPYAPSLPLLSRSRSVSRSPSRARPLALRRDGEKRHSSATAASLRGARGQVDLWRTVCSPSRPLMQGLYTGGSRQGLSDKGFQCEGRRRRSRRRSRRRRRRRREKLSRLSFFLCVSVVCLSLSLSLFIETSVWLSRHSRSLQLAWLGRGPVRCGERNSLVQFAVSGTHSVVPFLFPPLSLLPISV